MCESCWTRIQGWLHRRVYWMDTVSFRRTCEHRRKFWVDIGGLLTTKRAPGSASNYPRSTWKPWQHAWQHQTQVWQCRRQLWEHITAQWCSLVKTSSSLEMLLVHLEIIATSYCSTVFKTHVINLYSHLCIYVLI